MPNNKTIAIISYLTIIGFVVALVMNMEKKDQFAAFHIRQMLGLGLFSLASWAVSQIPLIGLVSIPFGLFLVFLWVMGLVAAINGEKKPVPAFGDYYQRWFAGVQAG